MMEKPATFAETVAATLALAAKGAARIVPWSEPLLRVLEEADARMALRAIGARLVPLPQMEVAHV